MKRLREKEGGEGGGGGRIEGCCPGPGERGTDLSRCPSVRLYRRPDSHPRGSTMLLTSCEFKQLSFCEVIPNALK